jgi:hypothetical protein
LTPVLIALSINNRTQEEIMRNRPVRKQLAILLLGLAFLIGPYSIAPADADVVMTKICATQFKNWQRREGHKAFALSQPVKNKQACGLSWKANSKRYAMTFALKQCREAAARYKLRSPRCQIIASQ